MLGVGFREGGGAVIGVAFGAAECPQVCAAGPVPDLEGYLFSTVSVR